MATEIVKARSVRRDGQNFRVMRPNNIIAPPTDIHLLRRSYKKVRAVSPCPMTCTRHGSYI